jgi:hypothetical protein
MIYSLITILIAMNYLSDNGPFRLPQRWTEDFTITLSYSGSMSGHSSTITFTSDSCRYKWSTRMEGPKETAFQLTAAERAAILKKLHELKADKIQSESSFTKVNDGWSRSICFNTHCIEGGTSVRMSEHDQAQFHAVYQYLEDIAIKKTERKGKK